MTNLTFVSGDFSSGTTLVFTLFRNTEGCHCLYEPLHERLLHWLVWPPRVYEGHSFVGTYFDEYKGFSEIPKLFDPAWGVSRLHLRPEDDADALLRYLNYLVEASIARAPNVVLKENRLTFRLGWLKANFPNARIVHVWRERDDLWRSIVRRTQEYLGREDVGQDRPDFMGFRMAAWCDDLAPTYPELAAERSSSGYERFSRLWELSREEHRRYADVSVELAELKEDFETACARMAAAVGFELDANRLRSFLAAGARTATPRSRLRRGADRLVDRAGARYAEIRVRAQTKGARLDR